MHRLWVNQAFYIVIMDAFISGVSTRQGDALGGSHQSGHRCLGVVLSDPTVVGQRLTLRLFLLRRHLPQGASGQGLAVLLPRCRRHADERGWAMEVAG